MARLKLSKEDCDKMYKKIIHLINISEKNFFTIKKLRGVMGYCAWENGIQLDYRRELLSTLVHECVHFLEPDWAESQVLYAEKRIINEMSADDAITLLKTFVLVL